MLLTKETIILNNRAHQKLSTRKEGTIFAASITIKAFMTKINKPKVSTVAGILIKTIMGRTMAFKIARVKATKIPVRKLST